MAKYADYIELSPGYESVVDTSIEARDPGFWAKYIVNDDMVTAVDIIATSLRREDDDKIRHFWLSGTYGTGKTYSSIVIKHLLEDDPEAVGKFLKGNNLFADVRDRFMSVRKKGPYLVIWKSGEAQKLDSSDKFLMELESSVLKALEEKGLKAGCSGALIKSVQTRMTKWRTSLREQYDDGEFTTYLAEYNSFDEFYDKVQSGDVDACSIATEILRRQGQSLSTDKETFIAWIKDIFDANSELKKTGIFIIWDEFTDYIRKGYDMELLQELSQFAKTVPFYILYVIHEYPTMITSFDPELFKKINARFHKITISLSDKTTNRLISETLKVRPGHETQWANCKKVLSESIKKRIGEFLPDIDSKPADLEAMYPIHPMTVALISKVAGNFVAANRSIFRFMKDEDAEKHQAGFRYFIRNNSPTDWKWVTPDLLWDYFFLAQTDDATNRESSVSSEECMKHYELNYSKISDSQGLRVFKCCMLLRATLGTGLKLKKTSASIGLKATLKTLEKCFYGQISEEAIAEYLNGFSQSGILSVAQDRGDLRFDIPYAGTDNEFSSELEKLMKVHSMASLVDEKGLFGAKLKEAFLPDTKAVTKRLALVPCYAQTTALNTHLNTLLDAIERESHKFGVLLVVAGNDEELKHAGDWAAAEATKADDPRRERLLIVLMKTFLPDEERKQLLTFVAKANLARRSGNSTAANSEEQEAETLVVTWVTRASMKELAVYHQSATPSKAFNNASFVGKAEQAVFAKFPYAPETVCPVKTLYRASNQNSIKFGLWHLSNETKQSSNPAHNAFNAQYQNIVDVLAAAGIWKHETFEEMVADEANYSKPGLSVLELCKYIDGELKNNTTVSLQELWANLQNKFGYYNNMVCSYLLGFAFRFYREAPYSWWDGANSHAFSDETITSMIDTLCAGKNIAGQRISIGNKQEKRFRDQTATIFGLSEKEAGNEDQCRKNLHAKITQRGYPVWTLKYLPEESYNGQKTAVCKIADEYESFSGNIGAQQTLMEQVVEDFRGPTGKLLQKWFKDTYADVSLLNTGMKNFIAERCPETADACEKYGFTVNEMFTMLRNVLQEEIYQWKVDEVAERLGILGLDIKLVGVANEATGGAAKTVERVREDLATTLASIRVPACVFEKENVEWLPTLKAAIAISINSWPGYKTEEKRKVVELFEKDLSTVLETVKAPLEMLSRYFDLIGVHPTVEEQQQVLARLHPDSYQQSEENFLASIRRELSKLEYGKLVNDIRSEWAKCSGVDTVNGWSETNGIPVVWLYPDDEEVFNTVLNLERGTRCDKGTMEMVLADLQSKDFSALKDAAKINACLLSQVATAACSQILDGHEDELKDYLRQQSKMGVWQYRNNVPTLQQLTQKFIQTKLQKSVVDQVEKKLKAMGEAELRETLKKVLEGNSELYMQLL